MSQHYYLVATLPLLYFEGPAPFKSNEFLSFCREQMTEAEYTILERANLHFLESTPQDHPAWRSFCVWESALRNELVYARANRLGVNPERFIHGDDFIAEVASVVKEALHTDTPKAFEAQLDQARWKHLDSLESGDHFELGYLIVYRLKLLLLERRSLFRPAAGLESFNKTYAQVLHTAVEWTKSSSAQ